MSTVRFTVSKPDGHGSLNDVQVNIIETENESEHKENGNSDLLQFQSGNLALYEDEIQRRPKISTLLSSFSRYQAVPVAPSEAEEGVTALKRSEGSKMGTLIGVYLPTIQNIFGVILFIRLSWIVGIAGVGQSFMIVATCCCCTMLTAISMSAIATNGVVPAGGSYFMISRSLGPEFGGAVGLLFYLGTTFAISMYVIGAVEVILTYMAPQMSIFGDLHSGGGSQSSVMLNNVRVYGTILLALMFCVVLIGVKYVNKCASIFLACVLLSILAIDVGYFSIHARESPKICLLNNKLLAKHSYGTCSKNDTLLQSIYEQTNYWNDSEIKFVKGIPGITSGIFSENVNSYYLQTGETAPGLQADKPKSEVNSDSDTSFFILLAIFFPSVTGIMAGSNRSGDLKDASKSIPKGTIAAIITTSTVYLTSIIFFGATVHGALLRDKFGESIGSKLVVAEIAWPHEWVILIGSCMSTVGAGMQSMTGAPRLLQAIARDDIIPFLRTFGHGSKSGEPTRALILTVCIAEIGILIANFDSVAPIITMFFLMCYGFVNLACVLQSLLKSPNWRPRFKYYHWITSALGLIMCLGMMFISSWYYALAAIFLAAAVYKYIEFQGAEKEWGDGIAGLALNAARFSLQRLEEGPQHTKNWRPQILVLCKLNPDLTPRVKRLLTFVAQLKHGRGLTMVGTVIKGEYFDKTKEVAEAKQALRDCMTEGKVKGFAKVVVGRDVSEGLSFLIQSGGLGGLTPNTVMIAWPETWREEESWNCFVRTVRVVSAGQEALLVTRNGDLFPDRSDRLQGHMDIWWVVHDGGMMILLVFLLHQHKVWRRCKLRIFTVAQLEDNSIQMKNDLKTFMYHLRIIADVEVIEMYDCDISEYTYERTLVMEQRNEMLKKMRLTKKESKLEVQGIIESSHRPRTMSTLSQVSQVHEQDVDDEDEDKEDIEEEEDVDDSARKPNEDNVRRMNTAVRLNNVIKEKSAGSELIVVNLPGPPKSTEGDGNYMEFIEVLTEGLHRVLMVRGGGGEVVTIYS